jgi:single-strand DNA-binding protein
VVNNVVLLGYLRNTPELSHTPNDTPYTLLVIETERTWRDGEGRQHTERDRTTVQVWRALAQACSQYLRINQLVYIEGRLQTREWEDTEHAKHRRTDVVAEMVRFLPHFHPPAKRPATADE